MKIFKKTRLLLNGSPYCSYTYIPLSEKGVFLKLKCYSNGTFEIYYKDKLREDFHELRESLYEKFEYYISDVCSIFNKESVTVWAEYVSPSWDNSSSFQIIFIEELRQQELAVVFGLINLLPQPPQRFTHNSVKTLEIVKTRKKRCLLMRHPDSMNKPSIEATFYEFFSKIVIRVKTVSAQKISQLCRVVSWSFAFEPVLLWCEESQNETNQTELRKIAKILWKAQKNNQTVKFIHDDCPPM